MYRKLSEMAAVVLENSVVGCWITSLCTAGSDCAKTGDKQGKQATQAVPTAKTSRFIESSFVSLAAADVRRFKCVRCPRPASP